MSQIVGCLFKIIAFFQLVNYADLTVLLYMPASETLRLLGIDAVVPYIVADKPLYFAINSSVMIKPEVTQHVLTWRNSHSDKQKYRYAYSLEFLPDHPDSLVHPVVTNISLTGDIPSEFQTFSMVFNCTGKRLAVNIGIRINITKAGETSSPTSVILHRKKICPASGIEYGYQEGKLPISIMAGDNSQTANKSFQPKPTSTEVFYVAVGVASGVIILVAIVIFVLYMRTRQKASLANERPSVIGSSNHGSTSGRLEGHNKHSSSVSLPSSHRGTLSSYSQLQPVLDGELSLNSIAINRKSVSVGQLILEGAFGSVNHGIVYVLDESEKCFEQKVLVKSISAGASAEQKQTFLLEGALLKGLNHQFINPVIAACLDASPLLLYPNCERGNLKLLLRKPKISEQFKVLNTHHLVGMAIQVARGLYYLHRKHITHKDIATRNCCVDSSLNVKITDYSLSRDLFPDDYSCLGDNENKPVKWMAIESLVEGKFSYSTDIWSFGVLLWELITFSQQPYVDVDPYEMSNYLLSGYRLLQPKSCPDELFTVMAFCWAMHSSDRPTLTQILTCLQEFQKTLSAFI